MPLSTITLPLEVEGWPAARIITRPRWNTTTAWTDQPMAQMAPKPVPRLGFELLRFRRTTIDQDGMAVFRFVFGQIDGVQYLGEVPDLDRFEVKIALQEADGTWATKWWGTVEHQADVDMAPGSDQFYGSREYHCLDGFARTRHWPMDRHGSYISSQRTTCRGHPGFNHARWDGRVAGTRESSSAWYDPYGDLSGTGLVNKSFYHTYPGGGLPFSDRQSCETAFAEARPKGEVPFYFSGAVALLSGTSVWAVAQGESLQNFTRRVCRRQRGRGLVYLDWDETGDPLTGTFTPKLVVAPQVLDDITYTPPGTDPLTGNPYAAVTLPGATTQGTAISITLIGDHRLGPDAPSNFLLGDRMEYAVNYLETVAEPIEVLITAAFDDPTPAMEVRWSTSEATAFAAASSIARLGKRYEWTYQLYGLARDWTGRCSNGNAGAESRADYRCDDDGGILVPATGDFPDTSALVVEVMRDLPLYSEYDYTAAPVRYDAAVADQFPPARRAPMILYRPSSNAYMPLAPTPTTCTVPALLQTTYQVTEFGLKLTVVGDEGLGIRTIGDPSVSSLGSAIAYTSMVFTLGVRLPHRMRFASATANPAGGLYTWTTAPRRKQITHPDLHLWLAHSGAIWDIDPLTASGGGYAAKRAAANAGGGAVGILRDDRAALAQFHQLAWAWYGSDHRTASWSLKACGVLAGFKTGADGATTGTFPKLGQVPGTMAAAGTSYLIATPITLVDYNHVTCETRWVTDWSEADFR